MFKNIPITLLLLCTITLTAQEKKHPKLLTNEANWGVEIFELPTGFAKEMTVSGFEEAIFTPGWSKQEDPEFWSYLFTWSVDSDRLLDNKEIEHNLILYFDGLVNIPKDTIIAPKKPTSALLVKMLDSETQSNSIGKVKLYDRFTSNKMLTLNLTVEQTLCKKQQKLLLVFRFSPKALDHKIWDKLNTINLRDDICE